MRVWNPRWRDIANPNNPAYAAIIQGMVMASINWLEQWPHAFPEWQEHTPLTVSNSWETVFHPTNDDAIHWFAAIIQPAPTPPSAFMMRPAVTCGTISRRYGWDQFDRFMLKQ